MNKTISSKIIALTFGVLVISFLAAFYVVAWQEPTQAPPAGNAAAPLNISAAAQTKEGDLTVNGVLKTLKDMIVNIITIKGDGTISTNFNSDKVDDYHAADLLAGGGGGCAGGLCSTLPVGYYIGFDWDGDGKTALSGDCDETCRDCWFGSATRPSTPDGKDQDCDGTIDEAASSQLSKTCVNEETYEDCAVIERACDSWCKSRGLQSGVLTPTNVWYPSGYCLYYHPNMDFNTCAFSGGYQGCSPKGCEGSEICNCLPITGYQ